ncbi:MAG: Stk1 family PASTA domain-containing Ser/Thr kinase [Oscillospiraceae bacterium]|jgi:serine/threonine-protein kinase|nr:Stk1 family PASTA domain-containing Ser/Thr kinase [Oscillospiraceae bacterium]
MDKYIGKELNSRYLIGELIGVGGMSNVYRAVDKITNRVVAIKILRDEYLTDPEFLRRFKNESKAIAALSSPNIVNVFDVSFNETSQWIVMEYIDGVTLKEYIAKKKILAWQEAVYVAIQVLKALQHAHDKGVVHRDIKPQNIMLLKEGSVKVMDFGIARFARNDMRTMTGKAIGSVHYISPEQATGGQIDGKTDIYSVGVMLFEMVTGRLPFEADNPVSVALKQIQSQPMRPRQINSSLPLGLEQIIMNALQKDQNGRYQSAAEMLSALIILKQNPSKTFSYASRRNLSPVGTGSDVHESSSNLAGKSLNSPPEGGKEAPPKSWVKLLMIISLMFCFMTVAIVFGALALSGLFSPSPDVMVPDLLGENYEAVKVSNEYSKFTINLETTVFDEKYAEGEICEQDPRPGKSVKEATLIMVKVSRGQRKEKMPDVVGREAGGAIADLKNLGLTVNERRVFSDDVAKDIIIRTEPPADTEVLVGYEVTVVISDGPENKKVKVPDLRGMTWQEAEKLLKENHLQLGSHSEINSDKPKDVVLNQSLAKGVEADVNDAIDVNVSSGVSDNKKYTLRVPLPKMNEFVKLVALKDGENVYEQELDITEIPYWSVEMFDKGLHNVQITINGSILGKFVVDFDNGTEHLEVDNSSAFEDVSEE